MDLGTYIEHNGRPAVRFERTYAHSVDRVWAAVSDPEELAHWFPSSVEISPGRAASSPSPEIPTPTTRRASFSPSTRHGA